MGSLDEVVRRLRDVLARGEGIDLWPPWDAVDTVVEAVAAAVDILTKPPNPDPADLTDAAATWRATAASVGSGRDDLRSCVVTIDPAAWEGTSGDAFRASMGRLATRTSTVPSTARRVAKVLERLSADMSEARERHTTADDRLRANLHVSWSTLLPWEAVDYLRGIVEGVAEAIREAIGAYQDAADAVATAKASIVSSMDEIDLPDELPTGVDPVSAVNGWEDQEGPLSGYALAGYDRAFADLDTTGKAAVGDALSGARSDTERAWIIAGVASGLSGVALGNYLSRLHAMTRGQLDSLDPPTDGTYKQPDQTTCGSSSLVMSRLLNDPAYAMWMETGYGSATGTTDPRTPDARFADESRDMHERTNRVVDRGGGPQVPWPGGLGTAPWGLANEMSADDGSGVPGTQYGFGTVAPSDRGASFDKIASSVEAGHHVPLYVGNSTRPGHIVLVTASDGDTLTIYEPAKGLEQTISRDDFTRGTLGVAGWDEPWFTVTPSS